MRSKNCRRPAAWVATSFSRNSLRNSRESTRTGRKKPGRQDTPLWPSKETPPPGTIMWTCGWWVSADPQVCSTEVTPIRAPRVFGIGRDRDHRFGGGLEHKVANHGLVLVGDVADRRLQREDHMVIVGGGKQLGLALGQPFPRRRALAFGQCRLRQLL